MPITKSSAIVVTKTLGAACIFEAGDIRIMPNTKQINFDWRKMDSATALVEAGVLQLSFTEVAAILGAAEFGNLSARIKAAAYKVLQAQGIFPTGSVT